MEMDKNGDGTLTVDELREAIRKVRPDVTEQEVWKVFQAADVNRDGTISTPRGPVCCGLERRHDGARLQATASFSSRR
jgi:hypothetical protein